MATPMTEDAKRSRCSVSCLIIGRQPAMKEAKLPNRAWQVAFADFLAPARDEGSCAFKVGIFIKASMIDTLFIEDETYILYTESYRKNMPQNS